MLQHVTLIPFRTSGHTTRLFSLQQLVLQKKKKRHHSVFGNNAECIISDCNTKKLKKLIIKRSEFDSIQIRKPSSKHHSNSIQLCNGQWKLHSFNSSALFSSAQFIKHFSYHFDECASTERHSSCRDILKVPCFLAETQS